MWLEVVVQFTSINIVMVGILLCVPQWTPHHHIQQEFDLRGFQGHWRGLSSHCGWRGNRDAPGCLSAHHRNIVVAIVAVNVKISHLSAIGDQVVDRVDSISLDNSGERGHFALSTRVPDRPLGETMLTRSNGEEVDLSCGGQELHWVFRLCAYYRASRGHRMSPLTTTSAGTREMV